MKETKPRKSIAVYSHPYEAGLPCGHGRRYVIGIEYPYDHPNHYDGVSEWKCLCCERRWGSWSRKELKQGETEIKYGGKLK